MQKTFGQLLLHILILALVVIIAGAFPRVAHAASIADYSQEPAPETEETGAGGDTEESSTTTEETDTQDTEAAQQEQQAASTDSGDAQSGAEASAEPGDESTVEETPEGEDNQLPEDQTETDESSLDETGQMTSAPADEYEGEPEEVAEVEELEPVILELADQVEINDENPVEEKLPDPYFCSDVGGGDTPGDTGCSASSHTTIAAALTDAVAAGVNGTIYIEQGGSFDEDLTVSSIGFNLRFLGGWDIATSAITGISSFTNTIGASNKLTVTGNTGTITFENISFNSATTIDVSDSTDVDIIGTDGNDTINVAVTGTSAVDVSVDGKGGDDVINIEFGNAAGTKTVAVDDSVSGSETVTVTGTNGVDSFTIAANVITLGSESVSVTSTIESLTLIAGNGGDTINLNSFNTSGATSLDLQGSDGSDTVNVNGAVTMNGAALTANAETVNVASAASITGASLVNLYAYAANTTTGSGTSSTQNLQAMVDVLGSINATGKVTLKSETSNTVTLTPPDAFSTVTIDHDANAKSRVRGSARVTAGALEISAYNTVNISTTISDAAVGTVDITADSITHAGISDGARVTVGSDPVSGTETSSVLIEAVDSTTIDTEVNRITFLDAFTNSYSVIAVTTTVNRDTQAYAKSGSDYVTSGTSETVQPGEIVEAGAGHSGGGMPGVQYEYRGGSAANVDETSDLTGVDWTEVETVSTTGSAKINAENNGAISSNTTSDFVGAANNQINKDDSLAYIDDANVDAVGLTLAALTDTDYSATGKNAINDITGDTKAYITQSVVTATTGGVSISAEDQSTVTATSDDFSLDMVTMTSDYSFQLILILNIVDRDIQAYIDQANVTAAGGNIDLTATNNIMLVNTAKTTTVLNTGSISAYTLTLGGSFAGNQLNGSTLAYIDNSTVTTTTSGDVSINAANNAIIEAVTELSSKLNAELSTLFGSTGALAAGVSIAINLIGWTTDLALATIGSLLTTPLTGVDWYEVLAYVSDSAIALAGALTMAAISAAHINATVSNVSSSIASSFYGAAGAATSGVLASNWLAVKTKSYIENTSTQKSVNVGGLSLSASDTSGIYANSKVTSTSITTSDGGVHLVDLLISVLSHDYESDDEDADGFKDLNFGDRVFLVGGGSYTGTQGKVYEYLGDSTTGLDTDLDTTDYTNLDFWKEIQETELTPSGYNISSSDSVAIGGLVVRNDVRNQTETYIDNVDVDATSLSLSATGDSTIHAISDVQAESSGGSVLGTGTSLAVGATISTNMILSKVYAYIFESDVDIVTGGISIAAANTSEVDATALSAVTSGAQSVGVLLAFNTIGYNAYNVLASTLDALLGTSIGDSDPDVVMAYVTDSTLDADGAINLSADNSSSLKAYLSSEATSAAYAFTKAEGMSATGTLTTNIVNSYTKASIRFSDVYDAANTIISDSTIDISASDNASIEATTALVTNSKTVNDAGFGIINNLVDTLMNDYKYSSKSGTRLVSFGEMVRLSSDYSGTSGTPEAIYQYMGGTPTSYNLNDQDYEDYGYWKLVDESSVIPSGIAKAAMALFDIKGGESSGFYVLVVRNDVRGETYAYLHNVDLSAGDTLTINAVQNASIVAKDTSVAKVESAQSIATGGVIATNQLLSEANAFIWDSKVVTLNSGNIDLDASNTSSIDAATETEMSATQAVSMVVSLNLMGWDDIAWYLTALDTILGGSWLTLENPVEVQAFILNSEIDADGSISLDAINDVTLNATVGNEADGSAKNDRALIDGLVTSANPDNAGKAWKDLKYGANGMSAGGILATNRVSSRARSFIENRPSDFTSDDGIQTLFEGAGQRVQDLTTGNYYEYIEDTILGFMIYDLDSTSGSVVPPAADYSDVSKWKQIFYPTNVGEVDAVDITLNTSDTSWIDSNSSLVITSVVENNMDSFVQLAANLFEKDYLYTTKSDTQDLFFGDYVRLGRDFSGGGTAQAGDVYMYKVADDLDGNGNPIPDSVNLSSVTINFDDNTTWKRITGNVGIEEAFPNFGNLAESNSRAGGGMVALNQVEANAKSYFKNIDVDASGNVSLTALEDANLKSHIETNVTSSGGSAWGTGTSLAASGQIVTNMMLSQAWAYIVDSDITTTGTGSLSLDAQNTSGMDASLNSTLATGDAAYGVTLAFNTIGWESQDVLTKTLDALIGSPEIGQVLGLEESSQAKAYIENTPVSVAGNLSLNAVSAAQMNATVSNAADSAASALFGANGKALAFVLASNMVSTEAQAYIQFDTTGTVTVTGDVTIYASDTTGIYSNAKVVSSSVTTNDGGASVLDETLADLINADYSSDHATDIALKFGMRIRYQSGFGTGNDGTIYEYMGEDTATPVSLAAQDYTADNGYWKAVPETELIPQGYNVSFQGSQSDSYGLGGMLVRNDVRSYVKAYVKNTTLNVGSLDMDAIGNATLNAIADSTSESSGGNVLGAGASLAVNATIATNIVISKVHAYIIDSSVTTNTGNLEINAANTSVIDASSHIATTSGAQSVGVLMAFNTVGYDATNILFAGLDALLGTNLGTEDPARALAYIKDSTINANGGDIILSATNSATINATVDTNATSAAYAFIKAEGMSASGILASNMISSAARAYITFSGTRGTVTSAGKIDLDASDTATINANVSVVTNSTTTNDAAFGVLNNLINTLKNEYQFTEKSGSQSVDFGDYVYLSSDYSGGQGEAGRIYAYMGVDDTTMTIGTQNFNDYGYWKLIDDNNVIPSGIAKAAMSAFGLKGGDSASYYVLVVRNELIGDVKSYLYNVDLTAATDVTIDAIEAASLTANNTSVAEVESSNSSGYGGVISTNQVLSEANASIWHSDITAASGKIDLNAENNSLLDATDESKITAAAVSVTFVLSFNVLGWEAQNLLFEVIDALIGSPEVSSAFNAEKPIETLAYIVNSEIHAGTNLELTATTNAQLNATVGNEAVANAVNDRALVDGLAASSASSGTSWSKLKYGASGTAVGGILASNKASSFAKAFIIRDEYQFTSDDGSVNLVPNQTRVLNLADSKVYEWVKVLFVPIFELLVPIDLGTTDFSDTDLWQEIIYPTNIGLVDVGGTINLEAYDTVGIDASSSLNVSSVVVNNMDAFAQLAANLIPNGFDYTTRSGTVDIQNGDRVKIHLGYANPDASESQVYEYYDAALDGVDAEGRPLTTSIDLGSALTLFTDPEWTDVTAFTGPDAVNDYFPNFGNLAPSNSYAVGGQIIYNDVSGMALAYIDNSDVDAGSTVTLKAIENAKLKANIESTVESSGGSAWGSGASVALNAQIVTNVVLSKAYAYIVDSTVDITSGDLSLTAKNTSALDATLLSSTTTGDTGINVTLAFNTLGWESQNILFNVIDALLGAPAFAGAFGNDKAAQAVAFVLNTAVNIVNGQADILAENAAQLNATVSNAAESAASALANATGMAVGAVLTSNMVNTLTKAYIDYTESYTGYGDTNRTFTASGPLNITANDKSGIFSNFKIVTKSSTSNDGGVSVLEETLADFYWVNYGSNHVDPVKLKFGDTVRYEDGSGTGNTGSIYQYMGEDQTTAAKLDTYDYTLDNGLWKEVPETQIIPEGYNVTGSDSYGVGGMIVYNDFRSEVEAYIDNATVSSGGLSLSALGDFDITATADGTAESSGGSAIGTGESVTFYGVIATNALLSSVDAFISDSQVTVTANGLTISAANTSTIDATNLSSVSSGDKAVGIVLAFNSLGWYPSNILAATIDALLGSPELSSAFGSEQPALVRAFILNSDINVTGDVFMRADGAAQLNAKVTNESTSAAAALYNASGASAAGIVATNLVSSLTRTFIRNDQFDYDSSEGLQLLVPNQTRVKNLGDGKVYEWVKVLLVPLVELLIPIDLGATDYSDTTLWKELDYPTNATRVIASGKITMEAEDNAGIDSDIKLSSTSTVTNDAGIGTLLNTMLTLLVDYQFTPLSGNQEVDNGDFVYLPTAPGGSPGWTGSYGSTYQWDGSTTTLDLDTQNYNSGSWVKMPTLTEVQDFDWTTLSGEQDIAPGDKVQIDKNYDDTKADPLALYEFKGGSITTVDLGDTDYKASPSLWERKISTNDVLSVLPPFFNVSSSDSTAVGGLIARNNVRGEVESYIYDATINAGGELKQTAYENAVIDANIDSKVISSGGSVFAGGSSLAVNAIISLNTVLSAANAYIEDSTVTTTNAGNVTLDAQNTSSLTANIDSWTQSNGTSVGVTLAFNTIGWKPLNLFSSTVEALLGLGIGTKNEAETKAYIKNSDVTAAGAISLTSVSNASISANILGAAVSVVVGTSPPSSISVSAILGMNKLATKVKSYIDGGALVSAASGNINVETDDTSTIDAVVLAASVAVSLGGGSTTVSVGFSLTRNEIDNVMEAYIVNTTQVTAQNGNIKVDASQAAAIDAAATTVSIAAKIGTGGDLGFAGGGAIAVNALKGRANAYINNTDIDALGSAGNVDVLTAYSGSIKARVIAFSVAVSLGTGTTPAASIGISIARNFIGWSEYGGKDPIQVLAYISNTPVNAAGYINLSATATSVIDALIAAVSAAIAGSTGSSGALSAGGVWVDNMIATLVKAYIDTSSSVAAQAGKIGLLAQDTSAITAKGLSASIALSLAGSNTGALSIGLALARNYISNEVMAFINAVASMSATGGEIILQSISNASITAYAVAASIAVGASGSNAFTFSGGGAIAENIILNKNNAYVAGSSLTTDTFATITATDTSTIKAIIAAVSGAISFAGSNGAAASIGFSISRNYIGWDLDFHYVNFHGEQKIGNGTKVYLMPGYAKGGTPSTIYKYTGSPPLAYPDKISTVSSGWIGAEVLAVS